MKDYSAFIETLKDIASEYDWNVGSYSGRGMFGVECVSITGDIKQVELGIEIGNRYPGLSLPRYCTDSMGLGIVVYWPSIPYKDEGEQEEEQEEEE